MANRAGGARARVTVAVPFPVYPPVGGGQRRVFCIYQHVARECDVEVVSLGEADSDFFEAEIAAGLTEVRIPKSVRHQEEEARIARAVGGIPVGDIGVSLLIEQTPEFVEELARSMREADLVVASHPYCLPAIEKTLGGKPLVYEAHNVEYVVKKGALGQSGGVGADLIEIVRRIEARACERSGLILCCSEKDREELQQLYGVDPGRVAIAPNGVDVEAVKFAGPPVRERVKAEFGLTGEAIVLFVGSWHPPNLEAAEAIFWMARALPGVKFLLAGSQCLPLAHRARPDNVGLMGVVDDETMAVLLTLADVALNPMRGGSGTNLKLATYFAAGVPVITTPLGARGYDLEDGRHAVICPLEDFPGRIREVLGNPASGEELARRARRVVEERYDWKEIGSNVARALLGVLGRRVGTAAMVEGLIEQVSREMSELGIPEDDGVVRTVAEAVAWMRPPDGR
jgi:glycosyltransferase involved in cell wall biosynthesis